MAQSTLLIQDLINTTKEEFFYHDMRIAELQQKEYPFSACKGMLDLLSKIDDEILNELDKLEKELSSVNVKNRVDFKQYLDKIRRYGHLVGILHYLLTFFEMGSREYIPEGSVVLIDSIVKKFEPNAVYVLVPIHEHNYTYLDLMKPLKKALSYTLPNFDEIVSGYSDRFSVFGFPLIQKENSILNSILAHEVGHFIDEVNKISDKLMSKVSLDPKIMDKIAKKAESSITRGKKEIKLTYFITPEELKAAITELAASQISEWLKELVADAIAFHLVGPVYLFSLTSFLVTVIEIDEAASDHPPPRMRIRLLLDLYEDLNYSSYLKDLKDAKNLEFAQKFISLVQSIEKLLDSVEQREVEDFPELVMNSVLQVIPEVRREVSKRVVHNQYEPDEFRNEVFKLIELLDLVIPPAEIEIGKPASVNSILNAGSLYELMLVDNLYEILEATTTKERMEVRHKLHKLILKALELSSIETRMKKLLKS